MPRRNLRVNLHNSAQKFSLLYLPDGRQRMATGLSRVIGYEFVIIDTRSARSVLVEAQLD